MAGYSVSYTVVDKATKQIDAINRRIAQMRAPMERMSRQVSRFVDVSGLRKVATGFEWVGKAASTVLRTLTAIVPVMGTIVGAASIAGMTKLVSVYSEWSHELVGAADNIGTTTQSLQQFEDATRLAGGTASDMRDGLKGLHDRLADFNRGGASAALSGQWAQKLGINLRDLNGHIRTATDLMPELVKRIGEMPDPADRAAAAQALLGSSGDKLVETFRQSSRSFADWFSDVKRYKDLTDDQKSSLQRFGEAQARVGVAFDRLGEQISAIVARNLGPLLEKFATFVEQNTPAILAAVDQLSARFATWLADPETGKAFVAAIKAVADSLVWVSNNLDTITTDVEVIAGLFAVKWAVGIVQSIGAVTNAFGVVGVGGSAGLGLLGALGLVIWLSIEVVRHWSEIKQAGKDLADGVGKSFERVKKTMSDFWSGKVDPADMPKPGETPSYPKQPAFVPGGAWAPPATPPAPPGGAWAPPATTPAPPGGAWARPPGAIQRQSATGGYLPGGVSPAAFHPGGVAAAGLAGGSEFWADMARAVTKGFEDAFDHITGFGGAGAVGGGGGGYAPGVQQAAFHVPMPALGPSPNIGPGGADRPGAQPPVTQLGPAAPGVYQPAREEGGSTGERNRNPLNLTALPGQAAEGRFRHFASWEEGVAGAVRQLQINTEQHGTKTLADQIRRWAPPTENATGAYVARVAKEMGIAPNAPLNTRDPETLRRMVNAMSHVELGRQIPQAAIAKGVAMAAGTPVPGPVTAAAPAATVPQQAPVNGSVDVSITHKNPPPNSAVTATGSGAVNVAPPRVEHQNMADI